MSLDLLAVLRSKGEQPIAACVTTDYATACAYATNAGLWPVLVEEGQEYDFSHLSGIPTVLALPALKGPAAQKLAIALMNVCPVTGFDLETNSTSVTVEA